MFDGEAGFSGQRNGLKRLPAAEIPSGKTVTIEMPGIARVEPGIKPDSVTLLQREYQRVPIAIVVNDMRIEAGLLNLCGGGGILDFADGFARVFIGMQ